MNGLRSPKTFVSITTRGVRVPKILKKKKVLTTRRRMMTHIRILHAGWNGPYINYNIQFAIDP